VHFISRTVLSGCCLLGLLAALLGGLPASALADGGAPQLAYVAGAGPGVSIIDIARQRVTNSITLGGHPQAVLLSPDGADLYVAQPALGQVAVIAAKTLKTICAASLPGQPSVMALSLDGTTLFAAGAGDTSARALNPATCAVERTFETREPIYGLAVAASTAVDATPSTPNQLWITGNDALTVYEVNGHLLGTVPIAAGPEHITIPGGFTAYVTTRQGTVVAVDLGSRTVIRTLLSGGQFGCMDYDAPTGEVYVPDQRHDQLDVLIPITAGTTALPQEPVRVFHLGGAPQSVAITNDGALGFVALANGQVAMLDVPGRKAVTSIAVGGTPHLIITGTYPPAESATTSPQRQAPAPAVALFASKPLLILAMALAGLLLLGALWLIWRYYWKRFAGQRSADKRHQAHL
jgi:DNA-binding beta-propeller fold protein YncE